MLASRQVRNSDGLAQAIERSSILTPMVVYMQRCGRTTKVSDVESHCDSKADCLYLNFHDSRVRLQQKASGYSVIAAYIASQKFVSMGRRISLACYPTRHSPGMRNLWNLCQSRARTYGLMDNGAGINGGLWGYQPHPHLQCSIASGRPFVTAPSPVSRAVQTSSLTVLSMNFSSNLPSSPSPLDPSRDLSHKVSSRGQRELTKLCIWCARIVDGSEHCDAPLAGAVEARPLSCSLF